MYYAMIFIENEWGNINVRALRSKGYSTIEAAINAIESKCHTGYIKMLGQTKPVWGNV